MFALGAKTTKKHILSFPNPFCQSIYSTEYNKPNREKHNGLFTKTFFLLILS